MQNFVYRLLRFECHCGHIPNGVLVGSTSDGALLVCWKCGNCGEDTFIKMPMEDIIANLPSPPTEKIAPRTLFNDKDKVILKNMHIDGA